MPKPLIGWPGNSSASSSISSSEPSSLRTVIGTFSSLPDSAAAIAILPKSRSASLPSISIISSPGRSPFSAAGEPGMTSPTTAGGRSIPMRKAIMKMMTALITLQVTPAARTAARVPRGLFMNERGSSVSFAGPVSSWPSILTKPPKGIRPIRYSVSLGSPLEPTVKLNAPSPDSSPSFGRISGRIRNRIPFSVLCMPKRIGGMKMENASTLIPPILAAIKWPNS